MKSPWLLRILALAGILICAYLAFLKFTGQISSIVGCGAGSGCANVLGSQWSQFFGIPVSALAGVLYLGLLVATLRPSRAVYAAFAISLTGAAIWFIGLLYFKLKAFCPWCAAMHTIGLITSGVLAMSLKSIARPEKKQETPLNLAPIAAVTALLVLVLGQIFGPKPSTHAETTETKIEEDRKNSVHAGSGTKPKGRKVSFFNGKWNFDTEAMPHLGPMDAPHVIVKYFDYTCSSCRDVHEDLQFVEAQQKDKICMIMMPVPLNRACNPNFPRPLPDHQYACELARLSLAAWRAKPEVWHKVHHQLFIRPVMEPEVAKAAVSALVGHDELEKALQDPWIDELITANNNHFKQLIVQTRHMPKILGILSDNKVMHGVPRSKEILLDAIEKEFKLKPNK